MDKLKAIEGLRGYLAIWVVIGHVIVEAGFLDSDMGSFTLLLRQNFIAVEIFILVSGFVICLLLDRRKESYLEFICCRFFRIYPIFILLFAAAIPMSLIWAWNLKHSIYVAPSLHQCFTSEIQGSWQHWKWNIFWHLSMLHSFVPDPNHARFTDTAFLGQAWSISLEWQFYLLAPFAYKAVVSPRPMYRIAVCILCLYVLLGRQFLPSSWLVGYNAHGGCLPFRVELFFIGAASYFLYKHFAKTCSDVFLPVAFCVAIFLWFRTGQLFISIYSWSVFMGLLMEDQQSYSSRACMKLFTNLPSQFLGRISYGIYLSHIMVMLLAEHLLLRANLGFSREAYFTVLLTTTLMGTVLLSAILFRYVESPGIRFGRKLAVRFQQHQSNIPVAA